MRKVLIAGMAGIAAFGAAGAVAVYLLTATGEAPSAAPATPGALVDGQDEAVAAPPAVAPVVPQPPPHLPERVRTWTPDKARFVPATPARPYEPEAEAERKKAIEDTLHRGRTGRRGRSAEDAEE